MNIQYQSCNIILDTSIRNDKNSIWIWEEVFEDFVKSMKVSILDFCIFIVYCMEREMIRKLSTNWNSGESSLWSLSKNRKTLFKWLLMSIIGLLIVWHYMNVKLLIDRWWDFVFFKYWSSKSELRACCLDRDAIFR